MNKNFRLTNKLDELADIVLAIKNQNIEFTIWQNLDGVKKIVPGVLRNHIHKNDKLFIDFEITDSSSITTDEKLFMFCPKFNILIKGKIKHLSKTQLQIKIDKKFYLNEQRELFRMDVEEKSIDLFIKRRIAQQNKDKNETVKLKDLSNSGCGFLVTSGRAVQFQRGNSISIEKVGKINLDEPIKGEIAHITPVEGDTGLNNKLFLVGIKFEEIFPNIDHLLQMVEFGMSKIES
jgi:hypothetical protein